MVVLLVDSVMSSYSVSLSSSPPSVFLSTNSFLLSILVSNPDYGKSYSSGYRGALQNEPHNNQHNVSDEAAGLLRVVRWSGCLKPRHLVLRLRFA